MSFDHDLFQKTLTEHLTNRLGWDKESALRVAVIGSDVLRLTHGGAKHYIPARAVNRRAVRADAEGGRSVAELAQYYGLSAQVVRTIIR